MLQIHSMLKRSLSSKEKTEQEFVNEKIIEIEVLTPSTSVSKQMTSAVAESASAIIKLLTETNQPQDLKFSTRSFGKQNFKRSFQALWFDKFK